jgi:hypothetical protein
MIGSPETGGGQKGSGWGMGGRGGGGGVQMVQCGGDGFSALTSGSSSVFPFAPCRLYPSEYMKHKVLIYRAPQCMSPRRNWDTPNPSPASECVFPLDQRVEGGHTRLRLKGWESLNSDDWRKS